MEEIQQNNLQLDNKVPVVAKDGQTIFVSDAGFVNVSFFQMRGQTGNNVFADVVASVRFQDIKDLEQFAKQIKETIDQHKSREP